MNSKFYIFLISCFLLILPINKVFCNTGPSYRNYRQIKKMSYVQKRFRIKNIKYYKVGSKYTSKVTNSGYTLKKSKPTKLNY